MGLYYPPAQQLIASAAFTAVASLPLLDLAAYRNLKLVIRGSRPATDGVNALLGFSSDGGSTWTAATLVGSRISVTGTTVSGSVITVSSSAIQLNYNSTIGNAATEGIWASIEIEGFNQAAQKIIKGDFSKRTGATVLHGGVISAFDEGTTAFNAMRFIYSSGNIAAVGNWDLFGVRG